MEQYKEFNAIHHKLGETGEFVIAASDGKNINFISQTNSINWNAPPTTIGSALAVPMQKALEGQSGSIIGKDYRGKEVLAAFAPIPHLNWGIDAKIDISEVLSPFLKYTAILVATVMIMVIGGSFLIVSTW